LLSPTDLLCVWGFYLWVVGVYNSKGSTWISTKHGTLVDDQKWLTFGR